MKKALIAVGSTFMRIVLKTALTTLDFEVVGIAKDGMEAVDKYMELKPDIVFVDVDLKQMDGIEVTRTIADENPATAIILLLPESLAIPDIIVEGVRAGATGYMRTPISEEEIKKSVDGALKRVGG